MTKPFFWIAFATILAAALFLGLRMEIERSQAQTEKKLIEVLETRLAELSVSSNPATPATAAILTPAQMLQSLEEAADKIPALASSPDLQKKEKEAAEKAEKALLSLGDKGFSAVEARFQRPGSLEFRRRLLRILGKINSDRAFQVAESALGREGEDYNVRWAAAAIMRELNGAKTLAVLSDFLSLHDGDKHPGMSYLVDTLAEIGGHEVAITMVALIVDTKKEFSVRNAAIRAVGEMRAVEAYPALQDIVTGSNILFFRNEAARSILKIKDREGCEFLRETMRNEKNEEFRQFLTQLLNDRCPK